MTDYEYRTFVRTVFDQMAAASADGALSFVCIDWRHLSVMLEAGQEVYQELINLIVWTKTNGGLGSLYRSQHELIPCFKKGTSPHINNVQLGKYGRFRTNVWPYAGVNTFKRGREAELAWHPTVKPVALVKDAIRDCSKPQGIILDPFGGSGTTLIAAAQDAAARLPDGARPTVCRCHHQAMAGPVRRGGATRGNRAHVRGDQAGAMAPPLKPGRGAMAKGEGTEDYAVGKGRPPRHSQFKKGQSGNPWGSRNAALSSTNSWRVSMKRSRQRSRAFRPP